ncbi:MAG: NADP-dependent oxidoreductase [Ktedonobacteraceae bacterium]|nr:NADP-dependent oxidoreductase [Ktedonobacteraceae bacterium]
MSKMDIRAIRVYNYGDENQLTLDHIPRPEPQAGEVLVRVHAAGVNPMDWKIRRGYFKEVLPVQFPYIPGLELAGIVEEVGPGVTAWKIGQAVYGQSMKGTYTDYAVAPVESLALKPQSVSFEEAATIPVGATTAWQALFEYGKLEAGQRVLIQGAAGGVGLFAVQFARWKGAHVLAATSSANVDFVRSLGAETVIDYTTTALASVVHDVDLVFDVVGGSALEASLQALKRGGTLVTIAGQPAAEKVQERGARVVSFYTQVGRDLLQTFAQLIDEGQVKVTIEKVFPLSEASQAHELSQHGHGRGRIVLRSV